MGFRTVVMLSNDQEHEWSKDAELGAKISRAMNHVGESNGTRNAGVGGYGQVVECVHADSQTLAVLDGYTSMEIVGGKAWTRGESKDEIALSLLKISAMKLGYRLSKIPAAK